VCMSEGCRSHSKRSTCIRAVNESSCLVDVMPSLHFSFVFVKGTHGSGMLQGTVAFRNLYSTVVTITQKILCFSEVFLMTFTIRKGNQRWQAMSMRRQKYSPPDLLSTHSAGVIPVRDQYSLCTCMLDKHQKFTHCQEIAGDLQNLGHLKSLCEEQQVGHFGLERPMERFEASSGKSTFG